MCGLVFSLCVDECLFFVDNCSLLRFRCLSFGVSWLLLVVSLVVVCCCCGVLCVVVCLRVDGSLAIVVVYCFDRW